MENEVRQIAETVRKMKEMGLAVPSEVTDALAAFDNPVYKVGIVGRFQVGKSHLVNEAFLNQNLLLKEGVGLCTTAVTTEVAFGTVPKMTVTYKDGRPAKAAKAARPPRGNADSERRAAPREPAEAMNPHYPNKIRKSIYGVYSAQSDESFPGLKLYDTDFLIPLNRMVITGYSTIDDPKADYGSGNAPVNVIMFGIREKDETHYFLTSALQNEVFCELFYLGKNISVENREDLDGWAIVTYKDDAGKIGKACVRSARLHKEFPVKDCGAAHEMGLDMLLRYRDVEDPLVWQINAEQLLKRYQDAVRNNDKAAIAKMYEFPMDFNGERLYTRAEFVERFDEIFPQERKEIILKAKPEQIFYSWRGALLPSGEWLTNACDENTPAGPLKGDHWQGSVLIK